MAKRKRGHDPVVEEKILELPIEGTSELEPILEAETADQAEQLESELSDNAIFLRGATEALIFASIEPVTEEHFVSVMGQRQRGRLAEMVDLLNLEYSRTGRAFEILKVSGGYQFFTRRDFSGVLRRSSIERSRSRVSRAALETLAVVAYRGPVTRAEIDEIRGVDSGGVLRTLLDRHLVAVKGRAQVVGKPLLYETTAEFLKHFGLSSLTDLPRDSELAREWGKLQELVPAQTLPDTDNNYAVDEVEHENGNGHNNGHTMLDLGAASGEDSP